MDILKGISLFLLLGSVIFGEHSHLSKSLKFIIILFDQLKLWRRWVWLTICSMGRTTMRRVRCWIQANKLKLVLVFRLSISVDWWVKKGLNTVVLKGNIYACTICIGSKYKCVVLTGWKAIVSSTELKISRLGLLPHHHIIRNLGIVKASRNDSETPSFQCKWS